MITDVNNQHYFFDDEIISKINEIIEKGLNKLKSIVKSKIKLKLDFYNELKQEFIEISSKLKELSLWEERRYFLSIKRMVLYIVRENSLDNHFGHCNFAVELINFFEELFKTNIEFYKNKVSIDDEQFVSHQESYKNKYHEYRMFYYRNIHEFSGNYTEEELYEVLKSLRE